jgi:hypothetical protein
MSIKARASRPLAVYVMELATYQNQKLTIENSYQST